MEEEIEKRKNKLKNLCFGWIKDNYDKVFLAVLIAAFVLRMYIFFQTMNQPLWWDEADYLSTAKRWGLGLDIRDIWYYRRGFLFPLVGALFFKLGIGEIAMRFLEVLFSTGIVAVSYSLISKMFNKKLALFASVCLTGSWILLFFTGRLLTDIPAAFFLLLSLLLFWKGYVLKEGNKFLYLFGACFALAVLTRMQSLMLAPPFLIYILLKEKLKFLKNKQLWITLGIFLLFLVPYLIFYSVHYGNPVLDLASHYLGIESTSHPVASGNVRTFSLAMFKYFVGDNGDGLSYMMYFPMFILLLIGIIYFLGDLIIGLDKIQKDDVLKNKFFVVLWILSLFLIMGYIGSVSYVEQRYITAALPFLFLIAVSPLIFVEKLIAKYLKLNKRVIFALLFAVLILCMVPNFIWSNNLIEGKLTSYSEIRNAGELIKADSNPEDIVMSNSLPQITYYSERSTYPFDPLGEGKARGDKSLLNYSEGEAGFYEFVKDKKPKYIAASLFESDPEWILTQGTQNGLSYIYMPFFNSSMVYNSQASQIASIDIKTEVKKEGMTLKLFYPLSIDNIDGVFIYKVEYS